MDCSQPSTSTHVHAGCRKLDADIGYTADETLKTARAVQVATIVFNPSSTLSLATATDINKAYNCHNCHLLFPMTELFVCHSYVLEQGKRWCGKKYVSTAMGMRDVATGCAGEPVGADSSFVFSPTLVLHVPTSVVSALASSNSRHQRKWAEVDVSQL